MKTNERSERLRADVLSVLRDSVHDKTFPGAVAALISRDDEIYIPYGFETYEPAAHPITEDSIEPSSPARPQRRGGQRSSDNECDQFNGSNPEDQYCKR